VLKILIKDGYPQAAPQPKNKSSKNNAAVVATKIARDKEDPWIKLNEAIRKKIRPLIAKSAVPWKYIEHYVAGTVNSLMKQRLSGVGHSLQRRMPKNFGN